ncbi:hypothetical protein BJ741DRAFT_314456 [Chytriomyces cf. hyalinus JEL632]|nr:hypothetical protein BJ741DRAFT_314456 [Chytriomyces cf. hyalinus JEL632]
MSRFKTFAEQPPPQQPRLLRMFPKMSKLAPSLGVLYDKKKQARHMISEEVEQPKSNLILPENICMTALVSKRRTWPLSETHILAKLPAVDSIPAAAEQGYATRRDEPREALDYSESSFCTGYVLEEEDDCSIFDSDSITSNLHFVFVGEPRFSIDTMKLRLEEIRRAAGEMITHDQVRSYELTEIRKRLDTLASLQLRYKS